MTVVTYERLVNEEKTRQVIGALLLGAAAGANAYAASQADYGTAYGTVNTRVMGAMAPTFPRAMSRSIITIQA